MEQENFKIHNYELKTGESEMVEKVKAMIDYLYHLKGKMIEVNERVAEIVDELRDKHPDLDQTYLFHIMTGSGNVDQYNCTGFDLPGEDSIVKRLENLVEEYKTE